MINVGIQKQGGTKTLGNTNILRLERVIRAKIFEILVISQEESTDINLF